MPTSDGKKEQNRKDFPLCAQWIDEMRMLFGEIKIKWCKEGNKQIGKTRR